MLRANFQDHRTSGSEKIFKSFYHIWAWWPSWSCDLYHLYKISFPLPRETPHKIWAWLAKRFQRSSLKIIIIYMYIAPGQGQTTPGVKFLSLTVSYHSVNIVLFCKFSSIK